MLGVIEKHFSINLNDYDAIGFNLEINKVVLGTFVALILGVIFLNAYRGNIRIMVMQLTRHNAKSEDSAKTLKELGLHNSKYLKRLLSSDNEMTRIVGRVGEVKYTYEEYKALSKKEKRSRVSIDFDEAKFYLREVETDRIAKVIDKYNVSLMRTVATCVFFAIFCGCIIACMPELLNIINNMLK